MVIISRDAVFSSLVRFFSVT